MISVDLDGFTMSGNNYSFAFYLKADAWNDFDYIFDINQSRFIIASKPANTLAIYDGNSWQSFGEIYDTTNTNFFVITINGTTSKAYLNGVQFGSDLTIASRDFSISSECGLMAQYNGANLFFPGSMSGFKAFNTALTAAQIADLYNNPEKIVPTGVDNTALKLWLPMMEGAGTTAINGAPDALGSEEVTNGDFATDSDWTKGTGWTISGGLASCDGTQPSTSSLFQNITGIQNKDVLIKVVVTSVDAGNFSIGLGGTSGTDILNISTPGVYSVIAKPTTLSSNINLIAGATFVGSVDSISIKELANCGAISGATWTHGIGAPVAQTSVIDWNKGDYLNDAGTLTEILVPQGLTSGRDLLGNLFENVRKQGALNLDGSSWSEVHDNASLDITTGLTLEAWVYWDGTASDDGIIGRWGGGNTYLLQAYDANNIRFYIHYGAASFVETGTSLAANNWIHVVGTYDNTNQKIYINGSESASISRTGNISVSAFDIQIGRYGGAVSTQYDNSIAQPRIYNRALTAEEVQRNYNAGKNIYS